MTVDESNPYGLSDEQRTNLLSLTRQCADQKLFDLPSGMTPGDAPDAICDEFSLLRYLKARKFSPHDALNQFQAARQFREKNRVFEVHDRIRVQDFETAKGVYPFWTGARDKKGLPVCQVDMVNMNKKTLAGWQDSRFLPHSVEGEDQLQTLDLLQLASAIFDDITRFVFPLCSALQNPCQPIASAIILVDASNMNMMQGFDLRVFARDVSSLLTTCYPETIHKIFVCNTPSYFATIWKFLKGWVDPVTADKLIFLTPSEVLPTLEEHIDTASLPASLGGSHPWKHGERPLLDEPTKALLKVDELPPGPMKWVVDDQGRRCLVAVGSEGGKPRRETVAVLGDR